MKITDIKVRKLFEEGPMKAVVSVTIDDAFAIHDIKVIRASERWFIVMPSNKLKDGTYRVIANPISNDVRRELEGVVLSAYFEHINNNEEE